MTRVSTAIAAAVLFVMACLPAGSLAAQEADTPVERYSDLSPDSAPIAPSPSAPPPSPAGPLAFYTDQAAFQEAVPDLVFEDWDGQIEEGISFDVLASGGSSGAVAIRPGAFEQPTGMVGPDDFTDDSEITFPDGTEAFGARLICLTEAAVLEVEVSGADGPLGSGSAVCGGPPGNFWGVVSAEPVFRVLITGGDRAGELVGATWFHRRTPPRGWIWAGVAVAVLAVVALLLFLRRHRRAS